MNAIRASIEALRERPHKMPLLVIVIKGTGGKADDLAGLLDDNVSAQERCMRERIMQNPDYRKSTPIKSGPCKGQTNLQVRCAVHFWTLKQETSRVCPEFCIFCCTNA